MDPPPKIKERKIRSEKRIKTLAAKSRCAATRREVAAEVKNGKKG